MPAEPSREVIAPRLARLLADADLAGFNIRCFDLPLLLAAFRRAVLDVQQIYHKYEPRNLASAVAHYCGRAHDGAHAAIADVEAAEASSGELLAYLNATRRNSGDLV
jgi:DNA polymerase-3 subunit epsilon